MSIDELAARRARNAPVSRVPSQHEYEMREARMYHAQVAEIEKAPLHERKAAAVDFHDAMRTEPSLVAERIGWLIDGNYGKGSYDGANQPSSSHFHRGTSYSTGSNTTDYGTGESEERSFHLKGFTSSQEREIFRRVTARR